MEWSRKARARAKPIKGITDECSVSVTGPGRTNLKVTLVRNLVNKGIFDGSNRQVSERILSMKSSTFSRRPRALQAPVINTQRSASLHHTRLCTVDNSNPHPIIATDKPTSRLCPPCPPTIRHPAALPLPLPLTLLRYSTPL
jgi:hypothetical protein